MVSKPAVSGNWKNDGESQALYKDENNLMKIREPKLDLRNLVSARNLSPHAEHDSEVSSQMSPERSKPMAHKYSMHRKSGAKHL